MSDEVLKDLWDAKDEIAKEHDFDVSALLSHLQQVQKSSSRKTVNLSRTEKIESRPSSSVDKISTPPSE